MSEPTPAEPGMDEILASIRRIIAEDESAAPPEGEGPLVLTERVTPAPVAAPHEETPVLATEKPTEPEHPIVDDTAASGAASSFDKLSEAVRDVPGAGPPVHLPPAGRTLEDLTRDLLRPMLKEWLDENLPRIVEVRVDEEVERITRRRVR